MGIFDIKSVVLGPLEPLNIIEFIEELKIHLHPMQKLILKCIYKIPFDPYELKIRIVDLFYDKSTLMTETEAFNYLCDNGMYFPAGDGVEYSLFLGRRSGKSFFVSFIILYEIYKFLCSNPSSYYKIRSNVLNIKCFTGSKDQSKFHIDNLKNQIRNYKDLLSKMVIRNINTIDFSSLNCDINISFPTQDSMVSMGSYDPIVIFDEFDHFNKFNALYYANCPSAYGFINPKGEIDGKFIMISSLKHIRNLETFTKNRISIFRIPTWLCNVSHIPIEVFKGSYKNDSGYFDLEFGAGILSYQAEKKLSSNPYGGLTSRPRNTISW